MKCFNCNNKDSNKFKFDNERNAYICEYCGSVGVDEEMIIRENKIKETRVKLYKALKNESSINLKRYTNELERLGEKTIIYDFFKAVALNNLDNFLKINSLQEVNNDAIKEIINYSINHITNTDDLFNLLTSLNKKDFKLYKDEIFNKIDEIKIKKENLEIKPRDIFVVSGTLKLDSVKNELVNSGLSFFHESINVDNNSANKEDIIKYALDNCKVVLYLLNRRDFDKKEEDIKSYKDLGKIVVVYSDKGIDNINDKDNIVSNKDLLIERLNYIVNNKEGQRIDEIERLTKSNKYEEAVEMLMNNKDLFEIDNDRLSNIYQFIGNYYFNKVVINDKASNEDKSKAFMFLSLAKSHNNNKVNYNLSVCYEEGIGVERSYEKAFDLIKNNSDPNALYRIGKYYKLGRGVEKDLVKAYECFLKSSNGKIIQSNIEMAYAYYYGIDGVIEEDKEIAIQLFTQLANGSYKTIEEKKCVSAAQYNLANIYLKGRFVQKNEKTALKYMQMAKDNENPEAIKWFGSNA